MAGEGVAWFDIRIAGDDSYGKSQLELSKCSD
jgi:hypothetical protein